MRGGTVNDAFSSRAGNTGCCSPIVHFDEGVFLDPPRGGPRNRAPHHHRGGDRPKALQRREHRPRRGLNERRAAERRAPLPQHSVGGTPCMAQPRPWMPLPRLSRHPTPVRATRSGAGRRAGRHPSTDNLVLLCPTHHRLLHEGGFDVQRLDDGAFRFTNPYGVAIRPPRRCATSSPAIIDVAQGSGCRVRVRQSDVLPWRSDSRRSSSRPSHCRYGASSRLGVQENETVCGFCNASKARASRRMRIDKTKTRREACSPGGVEDGRSRRR